MKRKIIFGFIIFMILTCFLGCSNPSTIPTEETYTVWTGSAPYSVVQAEGLTLDDGHYWYFEITKSQWNEYYSSLVEDGNEYRHSWTKAKIKDYLIGRGFGNSEATKRSSWLTTIEHGLIIDREGSMVHMILK